MRHRWEMGDGLVILWGADTVEMEEQSFLKEQIWWRSFTRHILMPLYGRFVGFNRSAAYLNPPLFFFFQLYPQMKALLCHVWSCVSPCAVSPVSTPPHLFICSSFHAVSFGTPLPPLPLSSLLSRRHGVMFRPCYYISGAPILLPVSMELSVRLANPALPLTP